MSTPKETPYANLEAEQAVLSHLLCYGQSMSEVADRLPPAAFYFASYRHRDIYEVMSKLYEKGRAINPTSVEDYLERAGVTECKHGSMFSYLNFLWESVYLGSDLQTHVKTVLDRYSRRRQKEIVQFWAQALQDAEEAEGIPEQIDALLLALADGRAEDDLMPLSQILSTYLDHLDAAQRETGKLTGIPTGIEALDTIIGGLQPQELYILGGQPGDGKSALVLHLLYSLLYHALYRDTCNVALFSLEMSHDDLAARLISRETGINSQLLRTRLLTDDQWEAVVKASATCSSERIFVDESGDLSVATIRKKARRHQRAYGLDLVIVDYMQLLHADEEKRAGENETARIAKISRDLKLLAKKLRVPVLVLSSLSRDVSRRASHRPQKSDLRYAGEFDADTIFFISRLEEPAGISLINVDKNRHGPEADVYVAFDGATMTFTPSDYRPPKQGGTR